MVLEEGEIIAQGAAVTLQRSLDIADLALDTILRAALAARGRHVAPDPDSADV